LHYLGAKINYGGRVTDDKDELLIAVTLKSYVCPEALKEGYSFSTSGIYRQPAIAD
jgi:dynein heavy chain